MERDYTDYTTLDMQVGSKGVGSTIPCDDEITYIHIMYTCVCAYTQAPILSNALRGSVRLRS